MITVQESDRQVEVCLLVRSETIVESPARFSVSTSSGSALGMTQSHVHSLSLSLSL